jgi:hypothetical protein
MPRAVLAAEGLLGGTQARGGVMGVTGAASGCRAGRKPLVVPATLAQAAQVTVREEMRGEANVFSSRTVHLRCPTRGRPLEPLVPEEEGTGLASYRP